MPKPPKPRKNLEDRHNPGTEGRREHRPGPGRVRAANSPGGSAPRAERRLWGEGWVSGAAPRPHSSRVSALRPWGVVGAWVGRGVCQRTRAPGKERSQLERVALGFREGGSGMFASGWNQTVPTEEAGSMAALLLLPLLLLVPLLLLKLHLWPQLRWLPADLAFAVRALCCKRALRARALAAAAADPESPEGGCSLAWRLAELAQQRHALLGKARAPALCFPTLLEFLESLEPDLPALRAMGLHLWAAGPGTHPAGISDLVAEVSAEVDGPVPGYLSSPQSITDTCLYIFTSGTTGLPKAARISHLKILQCQGFYQLCGVHQEDVIYLALPLYHMSGSLLGVVGCMGIGATVVLKSKFSAGQFWEDCQQHRVTVFQYIGELCRYLVNQPPSKAERGHKVRLAVGSGLRPDTWERFVRRFGPLQVLETYGLTEGNVATINYTGQRGAVGRASWLYKHIFPFSLIRYDVTTGEPIRDPRGHCMATSPGEPGLLVAPVSQQSPFLGYAGGPELAQGKLLKDVFRPGDVFFNTGDLLVCDDQGFLRFHDRTGDTFRWKGENVATTEVAEVFEALDFLQEVNVYGVTVPGNLPPYARPRFLRLQESLATTETFKQQKVRMANEGFDPSTLSDPLYVLDQAVGAYLPLTPARYSALLAGNLRI
uniref:Long-chain-fatty-acid--CoA ligase n=1 Tax=Nomascus leucogenys TaxID=61853 RepID=G1RI79_NOMLE